MWCFDCKIDQKLDQLILCKELGHDIDSEGLFQITNYDVNKMKGITEELKPKNPVTILAKFATPLMTKIIVSQSDNTRVFVVVKMNNHFETIELDKKNPKASDWLRITAFDKTKQMYSEETCANTIGFLRAKALMKEETKRDEIHLRIAYVNDEIYYDLGRPDWKLVKITCDGITLVDYSKDTPMFIRTPKIAQQVEPNFRPDGNPLDEFVKLCRMSNPELYKVHLISMFFAGMPMPAMGIRGHTGASKSTTSSLTKRIIDPSGIKNEDNLKSFPHGEDNFVTSLYSSYFSAFENISHIDVETSNMICRAITGGSFEKRAQYTNGDVYAISLMRKILINGVDFIVSQSDLADRAIIYELERILEDQRKTDKFIEEAFQRLLPDLLGQIFLTLQKVLGTVNEVEKQIKILPRMASFGIHGEAIYQALGHKQDEFLELYNESIKKNLENLYDSNPIIPCLECVLGDAKELTLQAENLYKQITGFATSEGYTTSKLPKAPNGLHNWFMRSKTLLDDNNIKVTKEINKQSKAVSGFTPNATIYNIKRIVSIQTALDNELGL